MRIVLSPNVMLLTHSARRSPTSTIYQESWTLLWRRWVSERISATRQVARELLLDVLSIIIEGQDRPQLTLVDIPGLIANDSKGVTKEDVRLVASITDGYIKNLRTICLAVVSALNDYANQAILSKVREVDPEGKRTLGIVTKRDGPPAGSGSEKSFIELAMNEDISFELGWHVVKNRSFNEKEYSLLERNVQKRPSSTLPIGHASQKQT